MSFLRPELAARLHRWREIIAAGVLALFGLRLVLYGGPFFWALGGAVTFAGAALALSAARRLRFARAVGAPGIVGVVEGQITYFGPYEGGFAALSDLTEIALVTRRGLRHWRLSQEGGTVLLIPVAAEGAERLYDVFAGLPGLETGALVAALDGPEGVDRIVWRRRGRLRIA